MKYRLMLTHISATYKKPTSVHVVWFTWLVKHCIWQHLCFFSQIYNKNVGFYAMDWLFCLDPSGFQILNSNSRSGYLGHHRNTMTYWCSLPQHANKVFHVSVSFQLIVFLCHITGTHPMYHTYIYIYFKHAKALKQKYWTKHWFT